MKNRAIPFILAILLIHVKQESKGRPGWQMRVAERERLQAGSLGFSDNPGPFVDIFFPFIACCSEAQPH